VKDKNKQDQLLTRLSLLVGFGLTFAANAAPLRELYMLFSDLSNSILMAHFSRL